MTRGRVVAAALLVLAVALTGCQKVTRAVATSVSPCFRVLPEAHTAVGGQGTLVDIARLRGRTVTTFPEGVSTTVANRPGLLIPSGGDGGAGIGGGGQPGVAPAPSVTAGRRDVCLVAFRGTFDPTKIQHLFGAQQGRYAVVIVGVQTQKVRGVFLTDTLPKPLHAH